MSNIYLRQDELQWLTIEFMNREQAIPVAVIACTLGLSDIYEDVSLVEE